MKSFAEKNIRYLLEFIVIISGVFLSFYLDDIRELGQKKQYKDTLIEELIITSNQDLLQLEKVITALNKVELSIDRLLVDIVEGDNNLSDKEIAEDYLDDLAYFDEKTFKANVDTLTLTATPIPRTLQFSLMGARDLSIIKTAPPNRQPVQTELHGLNEETIRDAISYEVSRGGQVFFVHNQYVRHITPSLFHPRGPPSSTQPCLEDTMFHLLAALA